MDILDKIIAHKRKELETLGKVSQAQVRPSTRDFCHFIATQKEEIAIIAEIKRSTPFKGPLLSQEIDPIQWAKDYEDAGAAAVSILTDEHFFNGSLEDLELVSQNITLPVLRKDFILDPKQIYQARLFGADAILLIVRCLTDEELKRFIEICNHIHMRPLVEIHDQSEMERALKAGARVIGINNRNLKDGSIDFQTTYDLVKEMPKELISVSESGFEKPKDLKNFKGLVDAVLIGSSIMKAKNPKKMLEDFVKEGENFP